MNRNISSNSFFICLMLTALALIGGLVHFTTGMDNHYVLIATGVEPYPQIMDNYKFMQYRKGLIYSLSLLVATVSFAIMILLPSEAKKEKMSKVESDKAAHPPRPESSISAVVEKGAPQEAEGAVGLGGGGEAAVGLEGEAKPTEKEELLEESLEDIDFPDEAMDVVVGEDDVVYGSEPISTAAIVDFVHKFPDSALKFLYRRQLDGKPLTNEEEKIYRSWEQRYLTRGKIKKYILTLMDWDEMPKQPLYEIWKDIRDHIFENF